MIQTSPGQRVRPQANALLERLGLLTLLLAAEWLPISALVSTGRGGQSIARALVAFAFLFFTFGYMQGKAVIAAIAREMEGTPLSWKFLAAHVFSMAVFLGLTLAPIARGGSGVKATLLTAAWLLLGFLSVALGAFSFVPPRLWIAFVRSTKYLWIYSAAAAALAWRFVLPLWSVWDQSKWQPAVDLTFALTKFLLSPFLHNLIANPATAVLGTPRFAVTVGGACSGVEGAGLMLVFSIAWLWFFRRECRFPQALVLVPASVVVMWLLNGGRLAALILIGNAGAPGIAMGGFHSQAGWISFNVVALGVLLAAERIPWWRRHPAAAVPRVATRNPTAKYLDPFIAILTAGMIAHAASAGFEWLYPLRFFAALAALWVFRHEYARMDRKCTWYGPAVGAVVFLIWMAFDALRGPHAAGELGTALAASSGLERTAWIACRVLAAVVTVPIAEELAFRGFLIRRLVAADFESLSLRSFTWLSLLVSSLIFGLLHGTRWVEGTIAGLLYAMALLRSGRIGDAVVAHATTNGLIALTVLAAGKWYLW